MSGDMQISRINKLDKENIDLYRDDISSCFQKLTETEFKKSEKLRKILKDYRLITSEEFSVQVTNHFVT